MAKEEAKKQKGVKRKAITFEEDIRQVDRDVEKITKSLKVTEPTEEDWQTLAERLQQKYDQSKGYQRRHPSIKSQGISLTPKPLRTQVEETSTSFTEQISVDDWITTPPKEVKATEETIIMQPLDLEMETETELEKGKKLMPSPQKIEGTTKEKPIDLVPKEDKQEETEKEPAEATTANTPSTSRKEDRGTEDVEIILRHPESPPTLRRKGKAVLSPLPITGQGKSKATEALAAIGLQYNKEAGPSYERQVKEEQEDGEPEEMSEEEEEASDVGHHLMTIEFTAE